jgi:hypothetical protein
VRLLRSLARTSARATGRALSAHVLPDSLLPSWKTQKAVSTGYSLLKKATRKSGKKNGKKSAIAPTKNRALAGAARPKPKAPKQKFDRNSWNNGRNLAPAAGYDERPQSPPKSSSALSPTKRVSTLRRQLIDGARNPRLVAQMGLDLLKVDYQRKKDTFLSNLKHAARLRKILKK